MDTDKIFTRVILFENSVFAASSAAKEMLKKCSDKCRKSIKNGPDYNFQVKVCSSTCRMRGYTQIISTLNKLKNGSVSKGSLNKKIKYFSIQLQKERMKYKQYREQLKKRQTKIPVSQSLKPSPERWDPKKLN